jgi:DNA-binding transcriptional ArsR family regulator
MRNSRPLDALFPRTRQRILAATLLHPSRWWYQSDLAKHLRVPPSSLQRELASLVQAGILRTRQDGNRVYFQPNSECPFLVELTGLLVKTAGLLDEVRHALRRFIPRIIVAFVHGSLARYRERSASDVDLLVVGDLSLAELAPALKRIEAKVGRPVNPSLYSPRELASKLSAGHHFLQTVLREPKLFVIGDEHDLEAITGKRPRQTARNEQGGA